MSNVENLRDTIVPKSDQLNADDLIGTTKIIKVTAVKRGSTAEQPVSIEYEGMEGRPYKPCKSMRRVLLAAWGDDGREWVGRSMQLYCDPEVKFGGVKVGGIRIGQLSHIEKDMKILLTTARGKRSESSIGKLNFYPEKDFAEKSKAWIDAILAGKLSVDDVIEKASATGILTDNQISILKSETKKDAA